MFFTKAVAVLAAGVSCVSAVAIAPPTPRWSSQAKHMSKAAARAVVNGTTHPTTAIFTPVNGTNIIYPRITELSDGTLLATAAYSGLVNGKPYFPIFASTDGGGSWAWRSNLTDQVNGLGFAAQPALAELPWDLAGFKAGTVLASGNSWGNASTNIDLYASTDQGATWKFVSNVARGSHPGTDNGNPCIWEPFILPFNNTIGMFYSDQRDPLNGQKLAHQESTDLLTWGPVVNDVAFLRYTDRPGMTVIDYVPGIKKWIFVHEFPGGDGLWSKGEQYPVYYRLADSPFDFRFTYSYPIAVNGVQPGSSPYVVWTSAGGPNGTIIVSDAIHDSVFTNTWNAEPDKWEMHSAGAPHAYSRALHIMSDNPDHLLVLSAGNYGGANRLTPLTSTVASVAQVLLNPAGK